MQRIGKFFSSLAPSIDPLVPSSGSLVPMPSHFSVYFQLDHMKHVNTAAERGILECQNQFSEVRWNCSATRERENDDIFGRISKIGKSDSFLTLSG